MKLFCKIIGHKVETKVINGDDFLVGKCCYCINQAIEKELG